MVRYVKQYDGIAICGLWHSKSSRFYQVFVTSHLFSLFIVFPLSRQSFEVVTKPRAQWSQGISCCGLEVENWNILQACRFFSDIKNNRYIAVTPLGYGQVNAIYVSALWILLQDAFLKSWLFVCGWLETCQSLGWWILILLHMMNFFGQLDFTIFHAAKILLAWHWGTHTTLR